MAYFVPSIYSPGDESGKGIWLLNHYLEHKQFIAIAQGNFLQTPDFDISVMGEDRLQHAFWLNHHEQMHVSLREIAGITGIDFSLVDPDDKEQWEQWLDDHASEHQLLRQAFGVT